MIELWRTYYYYILLDFCLPLKLVTLINISLIEIYKKVRVSKHLFDTCPTQNGLNNGMFLSSLLLSFALEYAIRTVE
jgi:hypothetical protein